MPNVGPESYDAWRERQEQSRHARERERNAYLETPERMQRMPQQEPEIRYQYAMSDTHMAYTTATQSMRIEDLMGNWYIPTPKPVSPNKQIAKLREKIKMHEGQIEQIVKYIEKARLDIKDLQEKLDKE